MSEETIGLTHNFFLKRPRKWRCDFREVPGRYGTILLLVAGSGNEAQKYGLLCAHAVGFDTFIRLHSVDQRPPVTSSHLWMFYHGFDGTLDTSSFANSPNPTGESLLSLLTRGRTVQLPESRHASFPADPGVMNRNTLHWLTEIDKTTSEQLDRWIVQRMMDYLDKCTRQTW